MLSLPCLKKKKSHTLLMTRWIISFISCQFLLPIAQPALNSLDPILYSWVSVPVPLFSLTSDKTLKREYFLVEYYYTSHGLHRLPRCCNTSLVSNGHQTWKHLSSLKPFSKMVKMKKLTQCKSATGLVLMVQSCGTGRCPTDGSWVRQPAINVHLLLNIHATENHSNKFFMAPSPL